jgi:long-subunit acyl-CoA synthetase (AMP-forming)
MFTHRNFVAGITCLFDHSVGHYNDKDRHLSYLPLPHLMERLFSFTIFYAGGVVV